MEKESKNMDKSFKVGLVVLAIAGIVCILSVTYAIWTGLYEGKKENIISTATLNINLDETSEEISLENAVPVSDSKGMTSDSYTFTVNNTSSIPVDYKVYLDDDNDAYIEDGCSNNKMSHSDIKYSIKKEGETSKLDLLSTDSGLLYESTIASNGSDSYEMHLWISSDATNSVMNKHFHGKLRVEVSQNVN